MVSGGEGEGEDTAHPSSSSIATLTARFSLSGCSTPVLNRSKTAVDQVLVMEKGKKEEGEDYNEPSEREIFGISGPNHLTFVDWRSADHRKSIVASLVQGVYILERDRQQKRQAHKALAPIWWDFFGFQLIQILVDKVDGSSFGAIFEYHNHLKPEYEPILTPPRYVLAFRGTVIKPGSRARDLKLDMHLVLNGLTRSSRYQMAFQALQNLVSVAGPSNIWMAGHSLGAAIALQAGKSMAKVGCCIESYIFNPPFASAPLEKITSESVKSSLRVVNSLVTAGLSRVLRPVSSSPFLVLCPWIPYMFLHPDDHISSEYIGYFEHRQKMESIGLGGVGRVATQSSVISLISGVIGRDGEATHLIPSAYLTKNMCYAKDFKQAHGIHQWWQQHVNWHFQLHQLKP